MAEVKKERVSAGEGIRFTRPTSSTKPPLAEREEEAGEEILRKEAREEEVLRVGKVPLHPAAVRLPASILGRIGTELTGYPGFTFTEQELNDLAELWIQCGIEMNPLLQASIGTTAMVGFKSLGYFTWVKAGKPPIPGAKAIGEETVAGEAE